MYRQLESARPAQNQPARALGECFAACFYEHALGSSHVPALQTKLQRVDTLYKQHIHAAVLPGKCLEGAPFAVGDAESPCHHQCTRHDQQPVRRLAGAPAVVLGLSSVMLSRRDAARPGMAVDH